MAQGIWLNLPVKDLGKSIAFFTAIGLTPQPGPGNSEHSACFVIGAEKTVLMLFTEAVFAGFTQHAIADTGKGTEVLFSLGADNRAQVDAFADNARSAGGTVFCEPVESHGFMYGCGFCDPDGHRWNALFMDPEKMPKA